MARASGAALARQLLVLGLARENVFPQRAVRDDRGEEPSFAPGQQQMVDAAEFPGDSPTCRCDDDLRPAGRWCAAGCPLRFASTIHLAQLRVAYFNVTRHLRFVGASGWICSKIDRPSMSGETLESARSAANSTRGSVRLPARVVDVLQFDQDTKSAAGRTARPQDDFTFSQMLFAVAKLWLPSPIANSSQDFIAFDILAARPPSGRSASTAPVTRPPSSISFGVVQRVSSGSVPARPAARSPTASSLISTMMCGSSTAASSRTRTRGGSRSRMVPSVARISVRASASHGVLLQVERHDRQQRPCPAPSHWPSWRRTRTMVSARTVPRPGTAAWWR